MIDPVNSFSSGGPYPAGSSRPYMPGYGVPPAREGKGLLAWEWAVEHLANARNYWLATTRPDGRAHMTPVWGIWLENTFYFSAAAQSRKIKNLENDRRCVVSPERGDEAVMVEGVAEKVTNLAVIQRFAELYSLKYQWPTRAGADGILDDAGNAGPVYAVHPQVVLAWGEFPADATRWVFTQE
jgi:nitroimidazol reductase NimA-like FMN-containing flavoprotein (pyridoxamine 5'-phosphate oxidase superfamily)